MITGFFGFFLWESGFLGVKYYSIGDDLDDFSNYMGSYMLCPRVDAIRCVSLMFQIRIIVSIPIFLEASITL